MTLLPPPPVEFSRTMARIVEMRGYLVIGTSRPCEIGEVIKSIRYVGSPPYACHAVVVAQSDAADYIDQAHAVDSEEVPLRPPVFYYRVVAE